MSYQSIRSALSAQLAALAPAMPIEWENQPFTAQQGVPYLRATLLPVESESPTIGGNELVKESGIFQVSVFYPVNGGTKSVYEKVEAVRAQFPKALTLTSGGLSVQISRRASVGPAQQESGWFMVPVSIPYFSYVFQA